jgi:hypothetical protein
VCLKAFAVVAIMYRGFRVLTRHHIFGVNRRSSTTFCPSFRVNEGQKVVLKRQLTPKIWRRVTTQKPLYIRSIISVIYIFFFSLVRFLVFILVFRLLKISCYLTALARVENFRGTVIRTATCFGARRFGIWTLSISRFFTSNQIIPGAHTASCTSGKVYLSPAVRRHGWPAEKPPFTYHRV